MLFFLVHSIADRSGLRGDWRVVVTQGRDGIWTGDHPRLAWARDFPVEFRQADATLLAEFEAQAKQRAVPGYIYNAPIFDQLTMKYSADAVVFIDADTVVTRGIDQLIDQVVAENCLAAKPAWQPPPLDMDAIIADNGLRYSGPPVEYSGYGWAFAEPRFGPPYLNAGFMVASREMANRLQADLRNDFLIVAKKYPGHYVWQVAQCLTMIRQSIPLKPLDERFNFGIGPDAPPFVGGDEGARLERAIQDQAADIRVLHYCTPTPNFRRDRVMASDEELAQFLATDTLDIGAAMLRQAFLPYRRHWEQSLTAGR